MLSAVFMQPDARDLDYIIIWSLQNIFQIINL